MIHHPQISVLFVLEDNFHLPKSFEELSGRKVVLAVEAPEVERFLGLPTRTASRGESCLYFSAAEPPLREPFLVVNAESRGPINNLCVPSQVASTYAPKGHSLVSVTVIGEQTKSKEELEHAVRGQLGEWYGRSVRDGSCCGFTPFVTRCRTSLHLRLILRRPSASCVLESLSAVNTGACPRFNGLCCRDAWRPKRFWRPCLSGKTFNSMEFNKKTINQPKGVAFSD